MSNHITLKSEQEVLRAMEPNTNYTLYELSGKMFAQAAEIFEPLRELVDKRRIIKKEMEYDGVIFCYYRNPQYQTTRVNAAQAKIRRKILDTMESNVPYIPNELMEEVLSENAQMIPEEVYNNLISGCIDNLLEEGRLTQAGTQMKNGFKYITLVKRPLKQRVIKYNPLPELILHRYGDLKSI